MSVVLAFGLSPLGQVPAYAAQKGGEPEQQEAPLGVQASYAGKFADYFTYTMDTSEDENPAITSNGRAQYLYATVYDSSDTPIRNYYGDGSSPDSDTGVVAPTSTNAKVYYTATLYYVNEDGTKEAYPEEAVVAYKNNGYRVAVDKAGTYQLKVTGENESTGTTDPVTWNDLTKTYTINVAKQDISGLMFTTAAGAPTTFTGADQPVSYELATVSAVGDDADVLAANYTKTTNEQLPYAERVADWNISTGTGLTDTVYVLKATMDQAEGDFESNVNIVHDAGKYNATITGLKSFTGSAQTTLTIDKELFVGGSGTAKIADGSGTDTISALGSASTVPTEIDVPYNKVSKPIELTYTYGTTDTKLVEGTDYTVKYYQWVETPSTGTSHQGTAIAAADLPSSGSYMAVISISTGSKNFNYINGGNVRQDIYVKCTVQRSGDIESFAKSAVLANATYLGGAAVTVSTEGATFFDEDGKDVTDLVGTGTKLTSSVTYGIAPTNTANTAKLYNQAPSVKSATTGISGVGDYTVEGVTSDGTLYNAGSGVKATLKVVPRVAKEGNDIGDLKVTVKPLAYNDGNYVDMDNQIQVQMYTAKNSSLVNIPGEEDGTGQMGTQVVNWTVKYYKDGVEVSRPSAMGDYTAVFSFSGNLEGTPDIEKAFTVNTGDITTLVGGIKVANKDEATKAATPYVDPTLTYTGKGLGLDKKNVKLVDVDNPTTTLANEDKLVGTDYELTYETGSSTSSLDADGKPLTAGTYIVKANFTGNYTGTVEGTLVVDPLSLRGIAGSAGNDSAELQYEQADGSWDVDYSAVKTGSAITPNMRVVVKDGNQKGDDPTVVDESVYTATFTNNVNAGPASVAFTTSQAGNVDAPAAAQSGAFLITEKSFSGSRISLSKDSADYASTIAPITMQVLLPNGSPLAYSAGAVDKYELGTVDVTVTVADLYKGNNSNKYYVKSGNGYEEVAAEGTPTITEGATDAAKNVTVSVGNDTTLTYYGGTAYAWTGANVFRYNGDYYVKDGSTYTEIATSYGDVDGTVTFGDTFTAYEAGTADVALTVASVYKVKSATTNITYYLDTAIEKPISAGTFAAAASDEGKDASGTDGSSTALTEYTNGTVTYSGKPVYRLEVSTGTYKYYDTNLVEITGTYAGEYANLDSGLVATGATVGNSFTPDASVDTGYSIKVLNSKGADVTGKLTLSCEEDPYTTVTIGGFENAGIGEFTVVVGATETGAYGGRLTAAYKVNGVDISDPAKYAIVYTDPAGVGHGYADEWAVDYDADLAKTKDGITLGTSFKINGDAYTKYIDAAKVKYEANKEAGTAKVTFPAKAPYTGSIVKEFKIDRADIATPAYGTVTAAGTYQGQSYKRSYYQIDWMEGANLVKDKATGLFHAKFTNADIKPNYEINLYVLKSSVETQILRNAKDPSTLASADYEVKSMLQDEHAEQWSNVKNVSYAYNSTEVSRDATVKITAAGNYEGSISNSFYIDPVDLYGNDDVVISPVSEQVWTGGQVIPAVSVTLSGNALTQGTDYVVTLAAGDNGTDEGEHVALIASAGRGNTTVSTPIQVKYTIKKASDISYDLTGATVALSASKFTYDGKAKAPTVTGVTLKDGTLLDAALYTATIPSAKDAKTYEVTVKGATANVTGNATASFTIAKAANTLKVAKAKRTAKGVSKAKKAVKGLKVKNAGQGAITYKKVSVSKNAKKFKVNSKTGKITVKKGTKKGTYKVTVKATAKGDSNHASASKQAVVTVKVKK